MIVRIQKTVLGSRPHKAIAAYFEGKWAHGKPYKGITHSSSLPWNFILWSIFSKFFGQQ